MHADSQSFKIYINPLKFPRQFFAALASQLTSHVCQNLTELLLIPYNFARLIRPSAWFCWPSEERTAKSLNFVKKGSINHQS